MSKTTDMIIDLQNSLVTLARESPILLQSEDGYVYKVSLGSGHMPRVEYICTIEEHIKKMGEE